MRRSVPLHYTDYGYGNHPVKLGFHHTLLAWIPYFKEVTLAWDTHPAERFDTQIDPYAYQCALAPMLFTSLDIRRDDYDYALAQKLIAVWRSAADMMLNGDYYALTPFHHSAEEWVVRQFDRPDENRGFIQGIRFPSAGQASITVHLKGLHRDGLYLLENAETGVSIELSGSTLIQEGFTFTMAKRSGAIWLYRGIPKRME